MFWELDLFLYSDEGETPIKLGPLQRATSITGPSISLEILANMGHTQLHYFFIYSI
jgi:hypothetical protein